MTGIMFIALSYNTGGEHPEIGSLTAGGADKKRMNYKIGILPGKKRADWKIKTGKI